VQYSQTVPDGMRYVLDGTAAVSATVDGGGEVRFALLDRDDVIGLTALTRQGALARTVATSDLSALFVPTAVLDGLVKTRPRLARDIGLEIDNRRTLAASALAAVGARVSGTEMFT
jgi:CRP-like cAMP-binding protein